MPGGDRQLEIPNICDREVSTVFIRTAATQSQMLGYRFYAMQARPCGGLSHFRLYLAESLLYYRCMRYKLRREYVWSDEIAYSVGLMASDGCLYKDGRHLCLVSNDIEQLVNFQKAIGREIGIKLHSAGKRLTKYERKQAYRLQFSDVAYYDFLIMTGLTPNKSKNIGLLDIPDKYYGHFLRGLFDGDGTTYAYYDPRWPTSYLYYVGFVSASLMFIEYLTNTNKRLFSIEGGSVRKSKRSYGLFYGKKDGYKLYRAMYGGASQLSLTRKRTKLEGFILQANSGTIL